MTMSQKWISFDLNGIESHQKNERTYWVKAYNFGVKIDLVISCRPYPRLICNTPLSEPSPCIPPDIIMV